MTSARPITAKTRSKTIPPEGEGGFSQCWYPVALSEEVEKGQAVGREFLDGRVVVYRGDDGEARVQSAYCRHLGADLSVGEVRGNDLVCAFHHWQYGPDGMCNKIPAGVPSIPSQAKLFAYPTAELMGVIWAFNGDSPLYDAPEFPGVTVSDLMTHAMELRPWGVPPWVLLANNTDFQHLRELHGMQFELDPDDIVMDAYTYEYELDGSMPNFGDLHQHISAYGNNAISLTMSGAGGLELRLMFAATPIPTGCRSFQIAAAPRSDGSADGDARVEQTLTMTEMMGAQLFEEDAPVMDTIRFRDDILIDADKTMSKYFRYVREFPRCHPGDGLIN